MDLEKSVILFIKILLFHFICIPFAGSRLAPCFLFVPAAYLVGLPYYVLYSRCSRQESREEGGISNSETQHTEFVLLQLLEE